MANRYQNIGDKRVTDIRVISKPVRQLFNTVKYPEIPLNISDTYVTSNDGDRWDILAYTYYGDSSYWWVISIANDSLPQNSLFIPPGIQIRIPSNVSFIIQQFETLNQ
jgi:phage tail protein X